MYWNLKFQPFHISIFYHPEEEWAKDVMDCYSVYFHNSKFFTPILPSIHLFVHLFIHSFIHLILSNNRWFHQSVCDGQGASWSDDQSITQEHKISMQNEGQKEMWTKKFVTTNIFLYSWCFLKFFYFLQLSSRNPTPYVSSLYADLSIYDTMANIKYNVPLYWKAS